MEFEPSIMTAAMAEIHAAYGVLSVTGAVDTESSALRKIEEDLRTGQIDPNEAVRRVCGMLDARESYH